MDIYGLLAGMMEGITIWDQWYFSDVCDGPH